MASAPYEFSPEERPAFPGSPYTPALPVGRRLGYAAAAVVLGIVSTLGNSLVTTNLGQLSGGLGLYAAEAAWFPAIYVAMNATANLVLVKARIRFGIPAVTHTMLLAYAAAALVQVLAPGFATELVVRAASGLASAALIAMTIYCLLEAIPLKLRPIALLLGISIPQFGIPLARLFPVELLAANQWQALSLIEMGLALTALAATLIMPLPPSDKQPAFKALDFVTIGLLVPATVLICGVIGLGRLYWWSDTPWLGWMLVAAIPMAAAAIAVEHWREEPLLYLRFIGTADILRFAAVAIMVRLALAEQAYGAVGFLTSSGLTNDQLRWLFLGVICAMLVGIVVTIATLSERRIPWQIMAASLAIALAAWLDSHGNNLTRPAQLYISQALVGFGTILFIGPGLLYGLIRVLRQGPNYFITLIVLFSVTQNLGGLAGSAILGTWQVTYARQHATALSEHLIAADPQVAARLAQGSGPLYQSLLREANVLAFNDVFRLVMWFALLVAAYLAYAIAYGALRRRAAAREQT